MSIRDDYQKIGEELVGRLNSQLPEGYHYEEVPIFPVRKVTWTPATVTGLDARVIADVYRIPPWLVNKDYDTHREHWRWRLRHFRYAWRWCKRHARAAVQ